MGKLAISLALLATSALGASDQELIQSTLLKPWVEALRSKDKAGVERLLHPAVRACITPSTKEFFDTDFERQTDSVPSGGYHITKFAPITGAPAAFWPTGR